MGWAEVLWAVVEVCRGSWFLGAEVMKKWSSMTSVPVAFFLLSSPLVVHVAGKSAPDNVMLSPVFVCKHFIKFFDFHFWT